MQKEMSYAAYAGIGVEGSSTIKAMILMECLHRGETSGSPSLPHAPIPICCTSPSIPPQSDSKTSQSKSLLTVKSHPATLKFIVE